MFSVKGSRFSTNRRGAGRRRRIRSSASSIPASPSSATASAPCSGSSRRPRSSTQPTSARSSSCFPRSRTGCRLRHVVEVRHDSFRVPEFVALLREFNVAVVCSEHETYPGIADVTSDFVYLRLQKGKDTIKTGYPPKELDAWAKRLETFAAGRRAEGPAAGRSEERAEGEAARRVRLCDPRGQGARTGRRHGADRAAEVLSAARPRNAVPPGANPTH